MYLQKIKQQNIKILKQQFNSKIIIQYSRYQKQQQKYIIDKQSKSNTYYPYQYYSNIKLQQYSYLNGTLKYQVLTFFSDSNSFSKKPSATLDETVSKHCINLVQLPGDDEGVSQATSSSCSNSHSDFRLIQDFRHSSRKRTDPRAIYYFRLVSYILLFCLLGLTSVSFYLKIRLTNKYIKFLNISITSYNLYNVIYFIPNTVRIMRNIYYESELSSTVFVSDRSQFYQDFLVKNIDDILGYQQYIDDWHTDSAFLEIYEKFYGNNVKLINIDEYNGIQILNYGETVNVSISAAVRSVASQCLDILNTFKELQKGSQNQLSEADWNRKIGYVLFNSLNAVVAVYSSIAMTLIEKIQNYSSTQKISYLIIILCSLGSIILSLIMLIPFVVQAHSNTSKVFELFVSLAPGKYNELIIQTREFLQESNKNYSSILNYFGSIDFEDNQRKEQEALSAAIEKKQVSENKQVVATLVNSPELLNEKEIQEIETTMRLEKIAKANNSSRNIMIIQIFGIIFLFSVYIIVMIILRLQKFEKNENVMDMVKTLGLEMPFVVGAITFARNDFSTGNILKQSGLSLFDIYYWYSIDNFHRTAQMFHEVGENMPRLTELFQRLRSSHLCGMIFSDENSLATCQTGLNNILSSGIEIGMYSLLHELRINHLKMKNAIALGKNITLDLLSNERLISFFDMFDAYLYKVQSIEMEILSQESLSEFSDTKQFDTIDFFVTLTLLIATFLVVLRWFLNQFEFSIWKTKRMLGVLPTAFLTKSVNQIKEIIHNIS